MALWGTFIGNYLKFGSVVQEMLVKFFLEKSIFSSGGHFVWQSKTVCAMLVEGRMGKIHVKLFKIWTSGSEGDVF